jgi:actin related protein 2/3 complex subunit 5
MARHNVSNAGTPGVSVHATGASSVSGGAAREFGVAPSRGDGGGMSVLLSWHEKVYPSYPTLLV